jgi:hypothetical protein
MYSFCIKYNFLTALIYAISEQKSAKKPRGSTSDPAAHGWMAALDSIFNLASALQYCVQGWQAESPLGTFCYFEKKGKKS